MLTFALCNSRMIARTACSSGAFTCQLKPHLRAQRTLFGGLLGRRRIRRADKPQFNMVIEESIMEGEADPGKVFGTDLRILKYPHPLLRASNAEIQPDEINEDLKKVSKEMLLIMYASRGVGLAAPQVGINKRLMVFNPEGDSKAFLQEVVMINPVIVDKSKKTVVEPEACLSFPGMSGNVRRHEWVKVEAVRMNGKKFKVKFEGWVAKIFQHEYDHLEGTLYIDKLEKDEGEERAKRRLTELIEEYRKGPYEGREAAL